ncbi:MAG: hypothetical protein MI717_07860 [Spirochaetales bacterium]|nr:hypothetical protein [Spirochaetales bacterium]
MSDSPPLRLLQRARRCSVLLLFVVFSDSLWAFDGLNLRERLSQELLYWEEQANPSMSSFSEGELMAPALVLADLTAGTLLYAQGLSLEMPPASLAKVMTLHLSLKDQNTGHLPDERMPLKIPQGGQAEAMRPFSSLFGLDESHRLTLRTLRRAAAQISANDAAWTLALLSDPLEKGRGFVERMNQEAQRLGMDQTTYVDPDGWSELSTTTIADQLLLAVTYLEEHPGVLSAYHAQPQLQQLDGEEGLLPNKGNTNLLLGRVSGVDGIKTGTIPEAGFHFMATSRRDDRRLVAIVMGLRGTTFSEGIQKRALEAEMLLEWGFSQTQLIKPEAPSLPSLVLRHGKNKSLALRLATEIPVLVRPVSSEKLTFKLQLPEEWEAPVAEGDVLGQARWFDGSEQVLQIPIVAHQDGPRRWRLWDALSQNPAS